MGREIHGGGGAKGNKGRWGGAAGAGLRGRDGGPAGRPDGGAAPAAAQSKEAEFNVRLESARQAMLVANPELKFVGLACCNRKGN